MVVCPNGHDSASEDFCDVCGMRIAASPSSGPAPPMAAPAAPPGLASPMGAPGGSPRPASPMGAPGGSPRPLPESADVGEPCPRCGVARSGQFCEACGFSFGTDPSTTAPWPVAPSAPLVPPDLPGAGPKYAPAVWTAVVSSDRDFYESVRAASGPDGAALPFPAYCAERRFRLTGNQMRIGRRSLSRGLEPEIDLTGPPVDPGISRLHAVLIAAPDGSWAVLDPGSANGTLVNGSEIPTGVQVPLHDGDRINLGAWTAITVHCG